MKQVNFKVPEGYFICPIGDCIYMVNNNSFNISNHIYNSHPQIFKKFNLRVIDFKMPNLYYCNNCNEYIKNNHKH